MSHTVRIVDTQRIIILVGLSLVKQGYINGRDVVTSTQEQAEQYQKQIEMTEALEELIAKAYSITLDIT